MNSLTRRSYLFTVKKNMEQNLIDAQMPREETLLKVFLWNTLPCPEQSVIYLHVLKSQKQKVRVPRDYSIKDREKQPLQAM